MPQPSQIGHYQITAKLGEGGMGTVYRATDTRLHREVAIKVLPAAFAEDQTRLRRFEREAQVLASLNHPNIAAIYGIEAGALVMELVEGANLAGPVPVETAMAYARQIAAGLEAAHEKGIIHRDLKPANIKVTPDGTVKVLDFGLAKAAEPGTPSSAGSPDTSPTMSLAMTQAGMILGTAAYMSPEQARGHAVDRRADIWAFGVILYEMLSGKRLYGGETVTDTLAAVMLKEPDYAALPADTPPRVRRLIELCLRRDPKQRLRDIGDARLMLDEPEPPAPAAVMARPRRGWLPWAVAGAAIALAAGAVWLRPKGAETGAATTRFTLPLPPGTTYPRAGATPNSVPSPDGRYLAFVAQWQRQNYLWIRPIGSLSAQRLDKTEGANYPFWSPDGRFIGFFADEKLKKIGVGGGAPQALCDLPAASARAGADGGTWNREGVIVFSAKGYAGLQRVSAMGGPATPVTAADKTGDDMHTWPQFLPDGRHLLYFASAADPARNGVYVQELGSTQRVQVLKTPLRAVWAAPGYLLFIQDYMLFAQRMNGRTFQLEGDPAPLAENVTGNESNGRTSMAASENGVLVYRGGNEWPLKQATWFDRQGKVLGVVGPPGEYLDLELAPDEKRALVIGGPRGRYDAWILDLGTGVMTRMTQDGRSTNVSGPWSPDSRRVAVNRASGGGIREVEVASGKVTELNGRFLIAGDYSPIDGSLLCTDGRTGPFFLSRPGDAKPQAVPGAPASSREFRFSPDGKFVAYLSNESGRSQLFVAAYPSFAPKRQVSSDGASRANWSDDGKELYFVQRDRGLMSAEIRTGGSIESGIPMPLFNIGAATRYTNISATKDGKRFLFLDSVDKTLPVPEWNVVLNWAADLKP